MALIDSLLQVNNKLLYLCFLSLGIYWVYFGDAFEKYITGKTGFAESEEPIRELPIIGVYSYEIQKTTKVRCSKYGKDFNISYSVRIGYGYKPQIPVNLTFDENTIPGSNLTILFEEIRPAPWPNYFKITPTYFSFGKPVSYNLELIFQKPAAHQAHIHLNSENYAIPLDGIALDASYELKSGEANHLKMNSGCIGELRKQGKSVKLLVTHLMSS